MARAEFRLPNGTIVNIEGSPEEIEGLLQYYGSTEPPKSRGKPAAPRAAPTKSEPADNGDVDVVHEVCSQIKSSDRFDAVESTILDQRSQLNRVLLPLFVIHEEMNNRYGLTSGDISKITRELSVPIGRPDVSNLLAKEASKYVIGDRKRVHGKPVHYKLSRRGVQYMEAVLAGTPGDE